MSQSNAQIIFNESLDLMKEGKIGSTGRKIKITYEKNGENITEIVNEPEPIHTFATWKALGFYVKKGEKAIASFTIWNYTTGKKGEAAAEEAEQPEGLMKSGYYYMKKASFFKTSQVERAGDPAKEAAPEVKTEAQPEPEPVKGPEPEKQPEAKKAAKSDTQKAYDQIVKNAAKEKFTAYKSGSYEGITYATEGHQLMKTTEAIEAPELEAYEADFFKRFNYDIKTTNAAYLNMSAKEIREGIKAAKAGKRNAKVVYSTGYGVTINANYLLNAVIATGANEYKFTDHKSPVVFANDNTFYMILPINTRNMPELEKGFHVIG